MLEFNGLVLIISTGCILTDRIRVLLKYFDTNFLFAQAKAVKKSEITTY